MTTTKAAVEALREQLVWHEERDKALSKQPPGPDRNYRRMEHCEQILKIRETLEAFDARTEGADRVERVARAICEATSGPFEMLDDVGRDALRHEAKAAIAAMSSREFRIGDFVLRHAPNGIWIGRTGGEGGEFATEHVERVIAQYYRENF